MDATTATAAGSLADRLIELGRAQQSVLAALGDALAEDGLTVDQWRVLDAISGLGDPTMGELAERTGLANATLSRAVDALEDAASVFRHPDAEDRRRVTVRVSESGAIRLRRTREIVAAWERAVLSAPGADAALDAAVRLLGASR